MLTRRGVLVGSALGAGIVAAGTGARAQPAASGTLRIAAATEWFSLDPHFHTFPANLSMAHNVFDALTEIDPEGRLLPRLAEAWNPRGNDAWVFRLRADARFSDGTPVTASDVIATIERVPNVRGPAQLTLYTRTIARAEAPDDRTVVFHTRAPDPFLPRSLSAIYVIPRRLAGASSESFNGLAAAVGSGPYRYVEWRRGESLTLEANGRHWGPAPAWRRVVFRIIPNAATREAALLAGDVDLVQAPSTTSVERLAAEEGIQILRAPSARVTYVQFHQGPEPLADMRASGGRNPFSDPRVRRAVSLAIPREAIRDRIMSGLSEPAGQIVPPGYEGHQPRLGIEPFDMAQAQALLRDAGWEGGFDVTFTTPNDRNVNGVRIVQAIAASLRRLNIRAEVAAVPLSVQQSTWRQGRQSMFLQGAGPLVQPYLSVASLTHTKASARGLGVNNESFFSNAELDATIQASLAEIDEAKRAQLMHRAAELVREHVAVIPVHHEIIIHAARRPVVATARADERIHAAEIGRAAG